MRTVLLLAASVLALTACGLRGELVRPVPMWGDPPNEGPNDPRTIKAEEDRKAADKAAREAQQKADDAARLGVDVQAVGAAVEATAAQQPTVTPPPPQ